MRHLLTLFDLTPEELQCVLRTASFLKAKLAEGERPPVLEQRVLALLFEKPSLRTRVSFQAGIAQLGGSSLFLGDDVGWGKREAPSDFAQVLGQFVDAVACRANRHENVQQLANFNAMPVINSLTDLSHPCQAIADAMTIFESCEGKDCHLVFVGDGNNVSRSLALISAMLKIRFTIACPDGYEIDQDWLSRIADLYPDAKIDREADPRKAVSDANVIYTDVWTSMGQETEAVQRRKTFAPYQVNEKLMAAAPSNARVMHCLPAVRGEEITDQVIDGPQSNVISQAGNRMHAQKGLLVWLMNPDWIDKNVPAD